MQLYFDVFHMECTFYYIILIPICVTHLLPVEEEHCIERRYRLIGRKHTRQVCIILVPFKARQYNYLQNVLLKQIHVLLTDTLCISLLTSVANGSIVPY